MCVARIAKYPRGDLWCPSPDETKLVRCEVSYANPSGPVDEDESLLNPLAFRLRVRLGGHRSTPTTTSSCSRASEAPAMPVTGVFAWLQNVREREATGNAGQGDTHRKQRRQGSVWRATLIAERGDMHRLACRLGSRDQATSIAMVVASDRVPRRQDKRGEATHHVCLGDMSRDARRLVTLEEATGIAEHVALYCVQGRR
jgi:hypothetical protein